MLERNENIKIVPFSEHYDISRRCPVHWNTADRHHNLVRSEVVSGESGDVDRQDVFESDVFIRLPGVSS